MNMLNSKRITALLTALAAAASLMSMQSMAVFAEEANEEEIDYSTYKPEGDADTIDWVEVIDEDGEVTYYDPAYLQFATRFGDVNADRIVGISDAVQLQRFLLGQVDALGNWWNADLNGNGQIDVVDYTMLKQQIIGARKSQGGTLAVGVVDMLTGEPIQGAYVHVFATYGENGYELGEWSTDDNSVMYFTGLPMDEQYTYFMDIHNVPEGYGNEFGNQSQQPRFQFGDKTELAVNARLVKDSDRGQVVVNMYDWARGQNTGDGGILPYGNLIVTDQEGNFMYGVTPENAFALPDGDYHVDVEMHQYPLTLMDPDSDFAAHIKEIYPDAEFTDQTGGIDFTVKDGKPDKELTFDLMPLPGRSNYVTVNCIDAETGEPLEGVVVSLTEAPNHYAKKVAEWTSDATGTHTFDHLLRTGDQWDPAYIVHVESVPEGYDGGFDEKISVGYVYGYTTEITYRFVRDEMAKLVSADVISFDDKSSLNDAANYEIWRVNSQEEGDYSKICDGVKPGEKVYLADGKYFAALDGKAVRENGYASISFGTRRGQQLKKFFDTENFTGDTAFIEFTVTKGKPDRALHFYLKASDPDDEADVEYDAETLAKYEALWGDTVLN